MQERESKISYKVENSDIENRKVNDKERVEC